MVNANVELAYGELAGFELASGIGSSVVLSAFAAVAVTAVALVGNSLVNTNAQATGTSLPALVVSGVRQVVLVSSATSSTGFDGGNTVLSGLGTVAGGVTNLSTGVKVSAVMTAISESYTSMESLSFPGFDIRAATQVAFLTEARKSSSFNGISTSNVLAASQYVANTRSATYSHASVALTTTNYSNTYISIASISAVGLRAYKAQSFDIQSTAAAITAFTGSTKANTLYAINSSSQTSLVSSYARTTDMLAVAHSNFSINTGAYSLSSFSFTSQGILGWVPGKPIYTSLPLATDAVIRPYEGRFTERPREDRSINWV
jgi:hypothetical protein